MGQTMRRGGKIEKEKKKHERKITFNNFSTVGRVR